MMNKLITVGCRVKVLASAFGDSTDPDDVAARGKVGEVVYIGDGNSSGIYEIEVQTDDDNFLLLLTNEVEVIDE